MIYKYNSNTGLYWVVGPRKNISGTNVRGHTKEQVEKESNTGANKEVRVSLMGKGEILSFSIIMFGFRFRWRWSYGSG